MKNATIILALGCIAATATEAASVLGLPEKSNAFTYNYGELSYANMQNIGSGHSKDRFEAIKARGSKDIDHNVGLIGSMLIANSDNNDLNMLTFGTAYHQEVKDVDVRKMDFIFHAELEYADFDHAWKNGDSSELGVNIGAGVRALIVPTVELSGDISASSNDFNKTALTVGTSYIFSREMQSILNLQMGDMDVLSVGVRYNF